jgi:hypothetical protein
VTENTEDASHQLIEKFLGDAPSREFVDKVKAAKRDEVLTRLAALLNTAFEKGMKSNSKAQVQQRWITICGYTAQVMARLVRDLEYEKLRADVDDLKKRVLNRDVVSPRRSRYTSRHGSD